MSANLEQDVLELVEQLRKLLVQLPSHHPFQTDAALLDELRGALPVAPKMWDYLAPMPLEEANREVERAGSCDECGAPISMVRAYEKLYINIERDGSCCWERSGEVEWYVVTCENGHDTDCY